MNSILTLYCIPQLKEEDNLVIDDLGKLYVTEETNTLLHSISNDNKITFSNFMLKKFEKEITIVVDISQSEFYPIRNFNTKWTYARFTIPAQPIINLNSYFNYYYYVTKVEYVAQSTYRLVLKRDALNTYKELWHYGEKTIYRREHQNRYKIGQEGSLVPIFSKTNENIDVNSYSTSSINIEDDAINLRHKFYLAYRKVNGSPAVQLYADDDLLISHQSGISVSYSASVSDLEEGVYYYAVAGKSDSAFSGSGGNVAGSITIAAQYSLLIFKRIKDISYGDKIFCSYLQNEGNISQFETTQVSESVPVPLTLNNINISNFEAIYKGGYYTSSLEVIRGFSEFKQGVTDEQKIPNINRLDRTLRDIYKVVECPYCPLGITYSGGLYTLPSNWSIVNGIPTCNTLQPQLERTINTFSLGDKLNIFKSIESKQYWNSIDANLDTSVYDVKCYTTPFIKSYFYYDSFNYAITFEALNYDASYIDDDLLVDIVYKQSNNVSSSLLFKFNYPQGVTNNEQADFSNYIISDRNNEMVLFNDDYLNYMRVGYNYDSKKKGYQTTMAILNPIITAALSMATIGATIGTSGYGALAMGSAIASGIGGVISGVSSIAPRENEFGKHIAELQAKSFNVQGSQDLDLFNYYGDNKLKFKQYIPENIAQINELFRVYGYASNRVGSESNVNSRIRFNFIQCSLDLERNQDINSFDEDIAAEIKAKYEAGVTYIHHFGASWDLERKHTNVETSIYNAAE